MSDPVPLPRWRLDAAALTAFAALALVATALATHPPLTGATPAFGPLVDAVVAPAATAMGYASGVLLVGGFVVASLYVARRGWGRLAVRALGWLVLAAATATALDLSNRVAPGYGPGGSLGAFLRFTVEDQLTNLAGVAVALAAFFGLMLAADTLVRGLVRRVVRSLHVGNRLVETGSNKVIGSFAKVGDRPTKPDDGPLLLKLPPRGKVPILAHSGPVKIIRPADDAAATLPEIPRPFELPPLSLLADPDPSPVHDNESVLRERAALLEKTFADFGLTVKVVGIHTGPVITQYEIALETGLRLSKVTTLADDLALNLKVQAVRVVAPLPGRNTVGIEVPNEHRATVRLKELIVATQAKTAKFKLPVYIGKDVEGRPLAYDLAAMPHLLIAGRTGTGKSVCLNAIILSLLYSRTPDECRLIMIDPKMVELSEYGKIPHLMHPVVTKPEKAEAILAWAVDKMEDRYNWLSRARVRNVAAYNDMSYEDIIRRINPESEEERQLVPRSIPYIVIIIDEVGDLIMSMKKEVESHIIRLAQKSRAAGIHVILATQKPTVDVITGLIKSNMPARICFQVASRADSMVVLDEKGADKLLGMGDMLYMQPSSSTIVRAQGAYVTDREIEQTVAHLECDVPNYESELLNLKAKSAKDGDSGPVDLGEKLRARDDMYEQAIEIVVREQRGSTSLLQRALGIGYGRASRLIDFMAEDGIVGAFNGSSARDVLVSMEEWTDRKAAVA